PPQPLPERLSSQSEQAVASCPRAPQAAPCWRLAFLIGGRRAQQQRQQCRKRQSEHQALLMGLLTHLAGPPLPAPRLPVTEHRFNGGALFVQRDQIPAQRQTAGQQQRLAMGAPPQHHCTGLAPASVLEQRAASLPALTGRADLLTQGLDLVLLVAEAG